MKLKKFSLIFIIFLLITAIPPLLLQFFNSDFIITAFWNLYILFGMLTLIICISCILGTQKNNMAGTQVFLISTVLKMLLCMFFVAIYVTRHQVNPIHFVCNFFYLYIFNTVFEIRTLLHNLRLQNPK